MAQFNMVRAREWKLVVHNSHGDPSQGGSAVRGVRFYGRKFVPPVKQVDEDDKEEEDQYVSEEEAEHAEMVAQDAQPSVSVDVGEKDSPKNAVAQESIEQLEDEEEDRDDWSAMELGIRGLKVGLIKKKNNKGWVQPAVDWLVVEKAKQFAASMPDCIGFAVHATEGVEFYSEDAFSPKKGYRESKFLGWQAHLWVSNRHYSPFYAKEEEERKKLDKLRKSLPENLEPEDLNEYLEELFQVCDENRDGVLEAWEFKKLMSISGFHFSEAAVAEMLVEYDSNGDGVIAFKELQSMVETLKERQVIKNVKGRTSQRDLEALLSKKFKEADKDGNGSLDAEEFAQCLRGIEDMNLSDSVIEILWRVSIDSKDADENGRLHFEGFVPVMSSLLSTQGEDKSPSKVKSDVSSDDGIAPTAAIDVMANEDMVEEEDMAEDSPSGFSQN